MAGRPTASSATGDRQANPIWNAASLEERRSWKYSLPREVIDEFFAYIDQHPDQLSDPRPEVLDGLRMPRLIAFGRRVRGDLLRGDGVAWIKGMGSAGLSRAERRLFYLALGASMGRVMDEYGYLYPVHDRGVDYRKQPVPVSMTREATGFHTDSSSIDALPDIVGLLCEEPSRSGGESLVTNALNVYQHMRAADRAKLEVLSDDFIRDVVTPGRERSAANLLRNAFPIFSPGLGRTGRTFRYMRYWIEKGHEQADKPLTPEQVGAMDLLDGFLASPENCVKLRLAEGDVLLTNNRSVAHGRESYVDTPGNTRRLQRIWIEAPATAWGPRDSSPPQ